MLNKRESMAELAQAKTMCPNCFQDYDDKFILNDELRFDFEGTGTVCFHDDMAFVHYGEGQ